jgi:hypothetical protein
VVASEGYRYRTKCTKVTTPKFVRV